jgi:23S rRNA pseudouridine2605 synthase
MKGKVADRRIGLARALSKLGYCSRSCASELVRDGRVRLNGKIRCDPETPSHPEKDLIDVDGRVVPPADKVYVMLNKPRGFVTTASDEQGRETVYTLLGNDLPWLAPVGRLDKASEGLLLLTNDSEWAARVLAPETHLEKIYHVQMEGVTDTTLLASMVSGVRAEEAGDFLRVKRAKFLRGGRRNSWIEVILEEGKNRQIRRLLGRLEISVLRLVRVAIGPLELGQLAKGKWRFLAASEKQLLDEAMNRLGKTRTSRP